MINLLKIDTGIKKAFLSLLVTGITLCSWTGIVSAGPIDVNLLNNPGFESDLIDWTTDNAAIRTGNPLPHSGSKYLVGGHNGSSASYTFQTIDLINVGFTIGELDSNLLIVDFGGWQSGWNTQTDRGKIEIIMKDVSSQVLGSMDLGWFFSNHTWVQKEGSTDLLVGTRYIDYGFYAQRFQGSNNDAYLDDAFLNITSTAEPVPEPATIALLGIGLAGLAGGAVRRSANESQTKMTNKLITIY